MPMLELSDEQVIELAKRLPREKQDALLRELLLLRWSNWEALSRVRAGACARVGSPAWFELGHNERRRARGVR
jgi:hypothetical protein